MSAATENASTAVLDLVGPPNWRDLGILCADLHLSVNRAELTLRCRVPQGPHAFTTAVRRYEVRELPDQPPPTFDLDTAEAAARKRLQDGTALRASDLSADLALCFNLAQEANTRRHAQHSAAFACRRLAWEATRPLRALRTTGKLQDLFCGIGGVAGRLRFVDGEIPPLGGHRAAAMLSPIVGAIAIAFVLGAFGPSLDAQPDRRHEFAAAEQEDWMAGEVARFEAEARAKCAQIRGDNGTYIPLPHGGIVCTDKRGRAQGRTQ